mgnify:CR=1 FL=1
MRYNGLYGLGFIQIVYKAGVSTLLKHKLAGYLHIAISDMRQTKILIALFSLTMLISCISARSEITPNPLWLTSSVPLATASSTYLTPTPVHLRTATLTALPFLVPTQPDEQVYIDPEGWYSVAFPAQWIKSGFSYVGSDGFFETDYLPEYAFVPDSMTVCEWLANIQTKNLYTVSWMGTSGMSGCQLISRPGVSPATTWVVVENPSADFAHRFFYVKTDNAHFERITSTFTWLRPVEEKKQPDFGKAEFRSEDADFWNSTSSMPSYFFLKEYALPPEYQGEDPSKEIFLGFVPPEALPTPSSIHQPYSPVTVESVNQTLAKYGYELRQVDNAYLYDLYQNGVRVLQNIYQLPEINLFQTDDGEKLIFFAHALTDPKQSPYTEGNLVSYLIQDEKISVWEKVTLNPMYPGWEPILVEDKPLFLGLGDGVTLQVWNTQHELQFSFVTYFGTHVPIKKFQGWGNHWVLEVSNFVAQDGEILNEKYKFEEVFNWSLISEKPFYFFRKGPQVGFSHGGQFFSTYYHEVIHGYCCGLALNDPMLNDNTLRFFGKRDGTWYYVVLEIK